MARARLLVLSLLVPAVASYADDPEQEARVHDEPGLSAMADRDCDVARRHFAQAPTEAPKAAFAEEASFLSAKAFDLTRNDEKAVAAYHQFLAQYPASDFNSRARFLSTDVYVRGVFEAGLPSAPGLLSIVVERGDDVALLRE